MSYSGGKNNNNKYTLTHKEKDFHYTHFFDSSTVLNLPETTHSRILLFLIHSLDRFEFNVTTLIKQERNLNQPQKW